jgi:hypothetical protein
MGQVRRLVGVWDSDCRTELMLVYECARQQRRGAMARHRREPLDPWAAIDPDDPDARELAHAWARGWDRHEAVLTAVGRGAEAAKAGKSTDACIYPPDSEDEDESFLVKHWLFGWRARGGRCEREQLAEVIPLRG